MQGRSRIICSHLTCPKLIFTDQLRFRISIAIDPNQERPLLFWVPLHVVAIVLERTMALATIAYLERRYAALEKEISDALRGCPADDVAIADLEYRKLIIADEIKNYNRLIERYSKRRVH